MQQPDFCFIMPYHISENRGGGAEVQAWLLAKELARRGYGVFYVTQSVTGKEGQSEMMDGVNVQWISHAKRLPWTVAGEYYRALKKISPLMVIQRMTSFETGLVGHYCRSHRVPFIWICTDNGAPRRWHFLKTQWGLSRQVRQVWYKRVPSLANAVLIDLARHYGMTRTTAAFTQNDKQRDMLKKSFGLESLRMISGHEPPASSAGVGERLAGRMVLWVGNLGANKRPWLFVELARRSRGNGWKFVMIGSKADDAWCRELFRDMPDNLEWLGRRSFEETLSWFDRAAWFVNTSAEEGFPNTYIQAWLRGVPVLTLGCDPDGVISSNRLGYMTETIDDMSTRLVQSVAGGEYRQLFETVSSYALRNHSVAVMTDRFLSALHSRELWIENRLEGQGQSPDTAVPVGILTAAADTDR